MTGHVSALATDHGLDLIGFWDVSIATPMGAQKVQYEFTMLEADQPGLQQFSLRGVARQGPDATDLNEVQVNGREITWTQRVTRPIKLTLKFTVTVDRNQLGGTAKAGALPASKVSGTRVIRL